MPKTTRKRKSDDEYEDIRRKLRKIEAKIATTSRRSRRKRIISSSESKSSDSENDTVTMQPEVSVAATTTASLEPSAGGVTIPNSISLAAAPAAATQASEPVANQPAKADTATVSTTASPSEAQDPELDQDVLALLGDAPKVETKFGKATHKDLASRWQEILEKGLLKETKDKLLQEYLVPENCPLLVAPTLNPEVKAALAEAMVKRDTSLMNKQKQLGVAIAAVNKAIELAISKESHTKILKPLSDACRLLCDSHYYDTRTRRGFVISSINADMKETITEAKRDKLLFGENIFDKLKAAKTIKRSGTELKQVTRNDKSQVFNKSNFVKSSKNASNSRLNWKTLPRKTASKSEAGKARLNQEQRAAASSSSQQRGAADQAAAARPYRKR